MPTQITQQETERRVVLRVEGELLLDDAILLERLSTEIQTDTGKRVMIDLADLDFLDSDSAAVLKRLAAEPRIELQGLEIFLQSAIDQAERTAL
jgi:anti-anti-sigma factor